MRLFASGSILHLLHGNYLHFRIRLVVVHGWQREPDAHHVDSRAWHGQAEVCT